MLLEGLLWVVSRQLEKSDLESVPSSEFGTVLPFPTTEIFADAKFLIGGNRPGKDIPQVPVNVRNAATTETEENRDYWPVEITSQLPSGWRQAVP
jgi:hypothetical protein